MLQRKYKQKHKTEGKRALTDADERRWLLPADRWEHWQVPFDTDPDWPQPLQDALTAYRRAWRQKMDEVNDTIARSAPQETLVDQPEVVKGVTRVSGPFTVEGVQPVEQSLEAETPIGGAPEELDTPDTFDLPERDPRNAEAHQDRIIRLLRKDGVHYPDNKVRHFQRLDPITHSVLHAEGEWGASNNGAPRRVAIFIGPEYGNITARQVEEAIFSASRGGYDDLVFAGFGMDAVAQGIIQDNQNPRVRLHDATIRPDIHMDDLLKDTPNTKIFTVSGDPRVELRRTGDGEYKVEMQGVDVYDPVANVIKPTKAEKVAAWFLDSDYDGRTFHITQAFFPDKSAWKKLKTALKTTADPNVFDAFAGTISLPFPAGEHRRVAVKVIDPYGNELMRVVNLT